MSLRLRSLFVAVRAAELRVLRAALLAVVAGVLLVGSTTERTRFINRPGVTFYVVAHADDWQLFMGEAAYDDLTDSTQKVVFIYLTAGDAALGDIVQCADYPGARPYYIAREEGALASVRLVADRTSKGCPDSYRITTTDFRVTARPPGRPPQTRVHRLRRVAYRNSVSYFLRLPDAPSRRNPGGDLLTDFYNDWNPAPGTEIPAQTPTLVTAVDSSTRYSSWVDLTATVRAILVRESAGWPDFTINLSETEAPLNPKDHPQHVVAGRAALDALPPGAARLVRWVGYNVERRPENLPPLAVAKKTGLYAAYTTAKVLAGACSDWWLVSTKVGDYRRLTRSYSRLTVREPAPSAPLAPRP